MNTIKTPINAVCTRSSGKSYDAIVNKYGETGFIYPLNRNFPQMDIVLVAKDFEARLSKDCKYAGVCIDDCSPFTKHVTSAHLKELFKILNAETTKSLFIYTTLNDETLRRVIDLTIFNDVDCYLVKEKNIFKMKATEEKTEPKTTTKKKAVDKK